MQHQFYNIVNDELRGSQQTHSVTDPRTEEELWECPVATTQDFEDAVTAAQEAFATWSQSTVAERQALLVKLADVLKENAEELASILMKETGKSRILAAQTALEDEVQHEDATTRVIATHIPLGTVAAISPWNFPLLLSNIKAVSALITGNCIILKPSPFAPYTVSKWVELSRGAFFNAGQVCVASKRLYVHENIYERFLERFVKRLTRGVVGIREDGEVSSVFGPLHNRAQYEVVKGIIEDCKEKGYEIVAGGRTEGGTGEGILALTNDCGQAAGKEQVGPILPVLSWSDEDDVIKRSNLNNAGLGASVYSSDLAQAERIARRLEAGSVWINRFERPNYAAYFAGIKDSGWGGEMGKQGLLSYCHTKCLHFAK
ncbi:hypothetical protein N0V88_000138 [Collariella sp. IMI 366227]|nr:hypothetical protein N0V88_000138 [Collariella sp. IMI 366227]